MQPLSAHDVLEVWERSAGRSATDRALLPLVYACTDGARASRSDLARLPLGRRDAMLLELYRTTFGAGLDLAAGCPQCGERLELDLTVDDVLAPSLPAEDGIYELAAGELAVTFRLPSSADLEAAARRRGQAAAREVLVKRCVIEAKRAGEVIGAGEMTEDELGGLAAAMAEEDPQAEVLLELGCPACGKRTELVVDVAECFWHQVTRATRRLLREVHSLARAYGWAEADVLAMSARRRRLYMEMLGV